MESRGTLDSDVLDDPDIEVAALLRCQAEAADHPDAIPAWTPMKEKGVAIEDDADKSLFF